MKPQEILPEKQELKKKWGNTEHRTKIILTAATIIILLVGGITASTVLTSSNNYQNSDYQGLVAEYRFDTGAGNTTYDTAGNHDGTINGATWTNGVKGKAINFPNGNGEVSIPDSQGFEDAFSGSQVAVSMWLYPRSGNDWTDYWQISNSAGETHRIEQGGNGVDSLYFALADTSGNKEYLHIDNAVNPNRWNHVVGVYDGSRMSLYVNGRRVGTLTSSFTLGGTDSNFYLNPSQAQNSKIDNLKIYNAGLNKSQIKSIYNSGAWRIGTVTGKDDPSKVLDISFQHQNSSHVLDTSGYNNHGQKMNGVKQVGALGCKVGRCYSFDGNDDYFEVKDSSSVDLDDTFTWMGWIKLDTKDTDNTVFGKAGAYELTIRSSDFKIVSWGDDWYPNYDYPVDKWKHVTVTGNGTRRRLYINGKLVASGGPNYNMNQSNYPLQVGNWETQDGADIDGKIDQLKIFDKELSQAEIIEKTEKLEGGGTVLDLRFNRNGGDKAHDYSGEKNHGTLQPNASAGPKWVDGLTGNALKFDGDNDGVDISNSESIQNALSGEGATIAFWVDLGQISSSWKTWFPWTATNDLGSQSARLEQEGDGDNIYVRWIVDPASAGFAGDGGVWARGLPDMRGKKFLHVSTFETTESGYRVRTFINDKLVSESTSNDRAVLANASSIGSFSPAPATNIIDSLKIYPYAISKSKVQQLYNSGKTTPIGSSSSGSSKNLQKGLVLSQTLNRIETCGQSDTISCPSGMNGKVAVDESGEANHGELVNGPMEKSAGKCVIGDCVDVESGSYLEVADDGSLDVKSEATFTAWVNLDSYGPKGNGNIIAKGGNGAYRMRVNSNDNLWLLIGGNNTQIEGGNVPLNEWVFVTGRVDSNNKMSLFVNGKKVASKSISSSLQTNTNPLYIGTQPNWDEQLDGSIDQVRVYNRSLSKEAIWKLYTRGRDRETGMAGPVARYRFDAGPRVCILNQGGLSDGSWGSPSDSELKTALEGEGWNARYVPVGDITENGWKSCNVIVFPNAERYPGFDKSANFCSNVNGEGTEHDVFLEMKEFMKNGGMFVGTWGAGLYYPMAWDGSQWVNYPSSCSQFSGGNLYSEGGGSRCSNLGYSCYSAGTYDYSNINQETSPAVSGTVTSISENNRWASSLDVNIAQAYNSTSGNTISGKYIGIEKVGEGYYLHPGGSYLFNPSFSSAEEMWNNLLTWYAGNGGQNFWDSAGSNNGTISGNGNAPAYTSGKTGKALKFDGSDVVEVSHSSGLTVSNTDELTITGWVRLRDTGVDNWKRVLEKGSYSVGGYSIQRDNPSANPSADERLKFYFANSNGWENSIVIVQPSANSLNEWHHFTVTVENSEVTTYFDGKKTNQETGWQYTSTTAPLHLGASDGSGAAALKGSLDDVRIYPYALSSEQVKKVMNSGAASIG